MPTYLVVQPVNAFPMVNSLKRNVGQMEGESHFSGPAGHTC